MELCQSLNLDNGTKLLFIPNSHHPVVSLQAWIRFGAGDEDESIAGIAHLFEHLLFKGTEKRAVGQIAREIESLGGDLNAFTSYDHTVMHLTLASEHTKQGFEVLSDAIINSVVNEDELSREKPVILEEIKRRNDRPGSKAGDLVRKLLFGDHPYHRPVIGYADVVNNTPREKIMEVYKRYYNRNNVFLVCCGDVSSEKALEYANQYFDKLPDGEKVATRNDSKKNNTFTQKFIHNDSPDSIMYLSCQGPSGSELDSAALDAWTLIMGQGESSRLHNRLVLEEGRVRSLGAWCWAPRNKGSIDFAFRKSGGIANETEWIIDRFWNEINRDLRRDELEKAKKNLLSGLYQSRETVDSLGERFAYCESISGGFDFDRKYIDAIKSLNLDKLYEIREKYFQPNSFVCGGIVPKGEKLPQSLKKSFSKSGIKKLNSKPLSKKSPKVKEFEHKGLKVILRPIEHLDLFSMRWVGLGGTRLESRKKAGLGSLWARTVNEGGRNADGNLWSQERINECIDRSCSSLSAVHGRNSWGLYLDGMAGDFDELFQMTSSLLHEPLFEKATIKLEKKHQIEDLITRSENPTAVLFQQFNQAMFGKQHAYGRSTLGSKKDIRERNREELVTYHKKLLNSPQVLCVVGQVSEQDIIHSLERYWSHKKKFNKKSDLRKIQKPQTPKKKIYAYENLPKEQCHILWGFPTCRVNHPDRWALHALNALLAGQSGRLFMELRDKLSLCYTVSASQMESLDGGYFGFYIGTSPEKKDQALEAMQKEVDRLLNEKISEKEWKQARQFVLGNHGIEEQRLAHQASDLALSELYGLGYEDHFAFKDKLNALGVSDLQRVAQKYFSSKKQVLSVVEPAI